MANKATKIVLVSLLVCSAGMIFFLLSFGTGNWLQPNANDNQGFLSLGLWEACFRSWRYYKDPTQNVYDGCRWMLSSDFDAIREWIWPCKYQGTGVTTHNPFYSTVQRNTDIINQGSSYCICVISRLVWRVYIQLLV